MDKEVELILSKLKIVSEEHERGMYLCDKEHSKLLLECITNLQEERDFYKCTDSMNVESNIELRAKIDKAIEYIKDNLYYCVDNDDTNLLNILKGSE